MAQNRPRTASSSSTNKAPATPNTSATVRTRSPSPTTPSNAKQQQQRPQTAPSQSTLPPTIKESNNKRPKIDIKDIWGKDGTSGSSTDLLSNLENEVRKLLEEKRHIHDSLHHLVEKKNAQVAALQLQLSDLQKDGEGLGLEAFPDEDKRLEAVKSISNRKLYCKHTSIRDMEAQLNLSMEQTKQMKCTSLVHEHMKKRLVGQRIEGQLQSRAMKEKLRDVTVRLRDLERRNIESYEKYGAAQSELAELHKSIDQTMEMWSEELTRRKEWSDQRIKFEKFCEESLQQTEDLELKVQGDLSEEQERKFVAKSRFQIAKNKVLIARNHEIEQQCEMESKRLMLAFKSIGIDVERIHDVDSIVKHIASFKELNENLLQKKQMEEQHLEELRAELVRYRSGEITEEEREGGNTAENDRMSNRAILEAEKKLNISLKKLEHEKQEFRFIEDLLQPIKVGVEHIAEKVLGNEYTKSESDDMSILLEKIRLKLEQYMEFCSQVKPDKASITRKEMMKNNRMFRIDSSLDISTKAFITASNADRDIDPSAPKFIVSPYNIRIKTNSETQQLEAFEGKLEPIKGKKAMKTDTKLASMFNGDDEDEDPQVVKEEQVFDRSTLKKKAHRIVNEENKARKRLHRLAQGGKEDDEVIVSPTKGKKLNAH